MLKKLTYLHLILLCFSAETFSQTVKIPHSTYVFDCSLIQAQNAVPPNGEKPNPSRTRNKQHFIIQSKAELIRLTQCNQDYDFDFEKNILIGVDGVTSGCAPEFCLFEVLKDTIQKIYSVNYVKTNAGFCRGMFPYRSFIQIEKPTENYQIELNRVDSLPGVHKNPASYFQLTGKVSEFETQNYEGVKISIQDLDPPYSIYFANSNVNAEGVFRIYLPRNKKYAISVVHDRLFFHENLDLDSISSRPNGEKSELTVLEKNIELRPFQRNDKIVLNAIYFETGKYDLKEASFSELNTVYNFLLNNPQFMVEISGHTDTMGDPLFNLELSKKRAQAVADYLTTKGVSSIRIRVIGYGDTQPITDNLTDDSRAKNRRIEFKIIEN